MVEKRPTIREVLASNAPSRIGSLALVPVRTDAGTGVRSSTAVRVPATPATSRASSSVPRGCGPSGGPPAGGPSVLAVDPAYCRNPPTENGDQAENPPGPHGHEDDVHDVGRDAEPAFGRHDRVAEKHERARRDQQTIESRELTSDGGAEMERGEAERQSDQLSRALLSELATECLRIDAPVGQGAQPAARQVCLCRPGHQHAEQAERDCPVGPAPQPALLGSTTQDERQEEGEACGHQHAQVDEELSEVVHSAGQRGARTGEGGDGARRARDRPGTRVRH